MNGLGYVFGIFSSNPLQQLLLLAPFIVGGIGLAIIPARVLLRRKHGRQLLGWAIMATLASYLAFILMHLTLPLTNTSFGAVQPVTIAFAVVYLLTLAFALLGLMVATRFRGLARRWRSLIFAAGLYQLLIFSVLFYAFYIETQWLEVTETQIALAKLPPGTPPIKVALISDIHMEHWTRRDSETVRKLAEIKPDLIVIAGDHINIDYYQPQSYDELKRFFAAATPLAKYGTYAVAGSVDGYDLPALLEGTNVKLLDDAYTSVKVNGTDFYLVGIRSRFSESDAFVLQEVQQNIPANAPKMLLYHYPDLAPEAAAEGYDFYFAGHTHGGQIALPFFGAVFTASKYGRTYAAGLYDLGGEANTRMYVTRGLGLEGGNMPRARLFARPEISVITFVPAPTKD